MPEYEVDTVSKEWLQSELHSPTKSLIVLDCRSSNEFQEGHIRSAVNFSIPSLILKRLATGKIDVTSTIKSRDLKQRIQSAYNTSWFILYNETIPITGATASSSSTTTTNSKTTMTSQQQPHPQQQQQQQQTTATSPSIASSRRSSPALTSYRRLTCTSNDATINVLHRRLKQDGCQVYWLKGILDLDFFYFSKMHRERRNRNVLKHVCELFESIYLSVVLFYSATHRWRTHVSGRVCV